MPGNCCPFITARSEPAPSGEGGRHVRVAVQDEQVGDRARTDAAVEFITGPLLEAPYRVGKPLRDTLSGFRSARLGTQWRVLYRIDESKHAVIVQDIQHRSSAYRRR